VSAAGELERVTGFCLDVTERRRGRRSQPRQRRPPPGPRRCHRSARRLRTRFHAQSTLGLGGWSKLLGHTEDTDVATAFGQSLPAAEAAAGLEAWFAAAFPVSPPSSKPSRSARPMVARCRSSWAPTASSTVNAISPAPSVSSARCRRISPRRRSIRPLPTSPIRLPHWTTPWSPKPSPPSPKPS